MITRVFIDSRHVLGKTHPFGYDVKFGDMDIPTLKGVSKVELRNMTFPKIKDEMYYFIKLGGFDSNLYNSSSSSNLNDCFCIVYFDNGNMAEGSYKTMKGSDLSIKSVEFDGQRPTLHSFKIEFLKSDGTLVDVDSTGQQVDHTFLLEITHA